MKKILKVVKKIIFAFLVLYAYNTMSFPLQVSIPINIVNIFIITILGFPALIGMIFLRIFFF